MNNGCKKAGGMLLGLAIGAVAGAAIGAACCRQMPAVEGFKKKMAKALRSMGSVADAIGYLLK